MTRKEFSEELKKYRTANNVGVKELLIKLDTYSSHLYRIENASNCYSMIKALVYADAVKAQLIVKTTDSEHPISSVEQLTAIIKQARSGQTLRAAAEGLGWKNPQLSGIENGKQALTIDKFLILADYYGLEIELRPKP